MQKFFNPQQIAIIGASSNPNKIGHDLVYNLKNLNYQGKIYPVNPKGETILNYKTYKTITDLPKTDLAVFAVPAKYVPQAVEECGQKEIKNIVIISAGFKEIGTQGIELENQIIKTAQKYNIRIIGPNCLGIINTHANLNASFAEGMPRQGRIALVSQSGAMAVAIIDWASKKNFGFSKIISLGNKADISGHDMLEYLAKDKQTEIIMFYLEDFKNGPEFLKAASNISQKKPVIIVKGGNSEEGQKAASSHTGALVGSNKAVKTALKQSGVIRANSIEDFFDYAQIFNFCPILKNNRIAIITNAGGPGIMTTDAVAKSNLQLAKFSPNTIQELKEKLPPAASIHNPIDVIGDARADRYKIALDTVLKDDQVDGVIVVLTPQAVTEIKQTAKIIIDLKKTIKKPIVASFIGHKKVQEAIDYLDQNKIAHFNFPERAIKALEKSYYFSQVKNQNLNSKKKMIEEFQKNQAEPDFSETQDIFLLKNKIKKIKKGKMLPYEIAIELLKKYNFPLPKEKLVTNHQEAIKATKEIGYPIVMKIVSPDILHKTDLGGVKVNIKNEAEMLSNFDQILQNIKESNPKADIEGILIQEMLSGGKEVIIGSTKDKTFGQMIAFGFGGIYVNIFEDATFRIAPINHNQALKMMEEIKAIKLLKGYRGEKPCNLDALADILVKTSQMVVDFPEISELDFNPVLVFEDKAVVADAKIVV